MRRFRATNQISSIYFLSFCINRKSLKFRVVDIREFLFPFVVLRQ